MAKIISKKINKIISELQYPIPASRALIFNPEGKILLTKSYKWKDKYTIPGGCVELGEKLKNTLKREIKEETNLDVYDIKFICFQEFIFDNVYWKKKHFILFDFACKSNSIKVKLDSEAQGYLWISVSKALKLPITSYTKKTIKEYLKLSKNSML